MKVKEGQWIRTKFNRIEQVNNIEFWFGVKGTEYNDKDGYIIDVSYNPTLLLRTGDLVQLYSFIIEVYIDEKTQDLSSYLDMNPILRNNITKIWTLSSNNNYMLQWEKGDNL